MDFDSVSNAYQSKFSLAPKEKLIILDSGSTFLEIGKTQLSTFEVVIPNSYDEQIIISELLSEIDAEIDALDRRLIKAQQVKQGMMQELLTGRIRLV